MMKHSEVSKQEAVRIALTSGLSRGRVLKTPPASPDPIIGVRQTEGRSARGSVAIGEWQNLVA